MHLGQRGGGESEKYQHNSNWCFMHIWKDPTAGTGYHSSPTKTPQTRVTVGEAVQGDWAFLGEYFTVSLLCNITFLTAETVSSKDFKRLTVSLGDQTCISLRPSQEHLKYYLVYNNCLRSISFLREGCIYAFFFFLNETWIWLRVAMINVFIKLYSICCIDNHEWFQEFLWTFF